MSIWIRRRRFLAGGLASFALMRRASAALPAIIADGTTIGRGKMLVVAFYAQPVTLDLSAVVRSDITIYTTRGEGGNNVKRAVSLAAQGRLHGADLVTHEFALEDIAEAFRVMRERIDDPIKIVIVP